MWCRVGIGLGARTGGGVVLPPAATSEVTTYTMDGAGAAFLFSSAVPLGEYVMGEPFVIADRSSTITQMGTASDLDGGSPSRRRNGAQVNPYLGPEPAQQSFDEMIGASTVAATAYAAAGNVDPTAAGAAYAIAIGDEKTITKSNRRAAAGVGSFGVTDAYWHLTIVPEAKWPREGDFRPGAASTDKTSRTNVADIDLSVCRSLDISALVGVGTNDIKAYATVLSNWRTNMPLFGVAGENLRVMQVMLHVSSNNYSAQLATLIWQTGMHLHSSNISDAQKLELAKCVVQVSEDLCASVERGFLEKPGAGQREFYHYVLLWAAALTGKAHLYAASQALRSNIDQQQFITSGMVGQASAWPNGNEGGERQYRHPPFPEDEGKALWCGGGIGTNAATSSILRQQYLATSGQGRMMAALPVLAIQAGRLPAGHLLVTGNGAVPSRGALIHFLDREYASDGYVTGDWITSRVRETYDLLRPLIGVTKDTTKKPDCPPTVTFTNGANQVSWDFTAMVAANAHSNSALTGQSILVSQDNVQFAQVSTSASGTYATPAGIPVWCALALTNANGTGRRSVTSKNYLSDSTDLNKLTPTGTAAGAVTNTVAPALHVREFPANTNAPWFIPASGTITLGQPIFIGTGLWTGAISGSPTLAMQVEATLNAEDWGAAGGTITADAAGWGSYYTPVLAEAGKRVRAQVTRNGVTVNTAVVTLGAAETLPSGTYVDLDFGYSAPVNFPTTWAAMSVLNGTQIHVPGAVYGAFEAGEEAGDQGAFVPFDATVGAITVNKSAGNPTMIVSLGTYPAGTYRIQTKAVIGLNHDATTNDYTSGRNHRVQLTNQAALTGATHFFPPGAPTVDGITFAPNTPGTPYLAEVDATFTLASTTPLFLRHNNNSNAGGVAGGDVIVTEVLMTDG